jgi:hypothetical protein
MPAKSPEYAVSDEAAAYIADALTELAVDFEQTHLDQIRRHNQFMAATLDDDTRQLDLFDKYPLCECWKQTPADTTLRRLPVMPYR